MNSLKSERRIQRVRHELRQREVTVSKVESVSPGIARVTFYGDALADFVSLSFDDHVKFVFSDSSGHTVRRDYTPVSCNPTERTIALEFALHEQGAATTWARSAQIGQTATIAGPRGSMIIPMDYDWHLLVGDSAAMPAIRRRLLELPAGTRTFVVIQASNVADHCGFDSAAALDVTWVSRRDELLSAVQKLQLPGGDGFVWAAGESACMHTLRESLLTQRGISKNNMRIAAYWKEGTSSFHERLDE